MAEMRKCKECGKLFVPKGREQYCSDTHYRPCPICGTSVIAKYLSDPPRKCDNCKGRKSVTKNPSKLFKFADSGFKFEPKKKETPAPAEAFEEKAAPAVTIKTDDLITEIPATIDPAEFCEVVNGSVRRYIGIQLANNFGFIPGHDYLLKAEKGEYSFSISATEDLTTGEEVDILVPYSSQISFHQHFARIQKSA